MEIARMAEHRKYSAAFVPLTLHICFVYIVIATTEIHTPMQYIFNIYIYIYTRTERLNIFFSGISGAEKV